MGHFEWGLDFDWQMLEAALDRDRSDIERFVATLCDSAGDDHINQGWINACLLLEIVFDYRDPQGGVRGLGCVLLQPSWGSYQACRTCTRVLEYRTFCRMGGFFGFHDRLQRAAVFHNSIRQSNRR